MTVTNLTVPIEILKNDKYEGWPVTIKSADVDAGSDGRKVLKAGTPITADGEVSNDGDAQGLLLSDLDVTDGDKVGVRLVVGTVYGDKILANGIELDPAAIAALPRITIE